MTPNHDFGSPCDCRECKADHWKDTCDVCRVRPTVVTNAEYQTDRKGIHYYAFTNYCEECWGLKVEQDNEEERKRLQARRERELKRKQMERELESLPHEPTPIKYAANKYREQIRTSNSDKWIKDYLLRSHGKTLRVEKVRNRWYCCKNRVDHVDFAIYL